MEVQRTIKKHFNGVSISYFFFLAFLSI